MSTPAAPPVEFLWLEITGRCQLTCRHCYAGSGPHGTHGTLTAAHWQRLIGEAASLGVTQVQFIGGEPTLHPGLPALIRHALAAGLRAEVFTNLVHVPATLWDVFSLPGVSLATSWYSDDPSQHAAITGRDTYRQTKANIAQAVSRGIPLRAGIIGGIVPGQRTAEAQATIDSLGVTGTGTDRARNFGRGTLPDPAQTCGHCGRGAAAILPDGSVTPCPMSRWKVIGNAATSGLATLLAEPLAAAAASLAPAATTACSPRCVPDSYCNPLCSPGACKPRT